jgi:type IV secretion system protein VirB10
MRPLLLTIATCTAYAITDVQPQATPVPEPSAPPRYTVNAGVKVPLYLMNTISTKQALLGDRVYLETIYPILSDGRIVIPPGSYVSGTVTEVKRPGRIKGKGELYLRFDSLTLPNGVTRDFRSRIGNMDGGSENTLDREEGKIKGGSDKGGDARKIAQGAQLGTLVGGVAGAATGRPLTGLGAGAAGGAAAGLAGVLLSRGPDVVLQKGAMLEMVLDRALLFEEKELMTASATPVRTTRVEQVPAQPAKRSRWGDLFPFPF